MVTRGSLRCMGRLAWPTRRTDWRHSAQDPSPRRSERCVWATRQSSQFPGELFCSLGLGVKERSPAAMTMLATCASGCLGYLHPLDAWEHGGYSGARRVVSCGGRAA